MLFCFVSLHRLINGTSGETPINVVDSGNTGSSPRIILNSPVTKIEKGGTDKDPWVKVTTGKQCQILKSKINGIIIPGTVTLI